ncbi:hypothetical protein JCM19000A_12650 [Silvimonas sp. JCM 19000]
MEQLKAQFHQAGYVHQSAQQSGLDLAPLRAEHDRLELAAQAALLNHAATPPSTLIAVAEARDRQQLCRFEHIAGSSPFFRHQVVGALQSVAEALVGAPLLLFKDKCNLKRPGGGGFAPHQDITAYRHFDSSFHITAALMLEPATARNGALEMAAPGWAKGQHDTLINTPRGRLPVLPSYVGGARNGDIRDEFAATMHWNLLEAAPGDIVFFDSFVPHRSAENRSDHTRRILFFTFSLQAEGERYAPYYRAKREQPGHPMFHVSTPTLHDALT